MHRAFFQPSMKQCCVYKHVKSNDYCICQAFVRLLASRSFDFLKYLKATRSCAVLHYGNTHITLNFYHLQMRILQQNVVSC